jgi:cytochrome c556
MESTIARRAGAGALTFAAALLVITVALSFEGNAQGGGQAPPANPNAPTKALVPVAASSVAANPDPLYGEFVTMTGAVEQAFSKFSFSVDQDKTKTTGKDVLVLALRMSDPVTPNTYVTVVGELVKFDPVETVAKAKNFKIDVPPEVAAKYVGKPAVLAVNVVNDKSLDLARFIPPPMSPEETLLDKTMKGVGPANAELRKGVDGSSVDLVKKNTAILRQAFTDTEAFWKMRGKQDAMKWASDARAVVESIDKACTTEKPDWAAVKASADNLAKACATCHGAYRERLEDGSFRAKSGG